MLKELQHVRQITDDRHRRIFTDECLEVVVWYAPSGSIYGFQLSYDLKNKPRALTWTPKHSFSHAVIDGGEDSVYSNRTPLLPPDANYESALLLQYFCRSSPGLPAPEKAFIDAKLAESVSRSNG
jgi:hypothetical protein